MSELRPLQPDDLYQLRLITDPQISPDSQRIAFVLRQMDKDQDTYISNIYVADSSGTVTQFTSGDKDSAPRWSPDGKYLAFLSGRKEEPQLYLMPASGGEGVQLTDRKKGAGVPFWSPDSSTIAFVGPVPITPPNEEEGEEKRAPTRVLERSSYKLDSAGFVFSVRRHLFCVDLRTRETTQLTDGDFHDDNPAWSPDSRSIAFVSNREPQWDISPASDVYIVTLEGETREVTRGNAFHAPSFSPDGTRIAVSGKVDPEQVFTPNRLFSVNLEGGDMEDETGTWDGSLGNDVAGDVVRTADNTLLHWRQDGIYFLATVRGECNIYRARNGSVDAVTSGPQTVNGFSIAPNGAIAYARADSTHLADLYVLEDGQSRQLTHENDEFLSSIAVVEPERFTFTGARGEESEGWLLRPPGEGPHPLIVYIHGGPATAHGEALFFEYQYLAGLGFGVFYPNIHGSSSYGADYQRSIVNDWGNLDYQDVLAGTEAAASREWVDRSRLGIAGGSYGGYMTNWVMGHTDRFKAAITERCCSNLVSFMGTTDHGWLWNRAWGFYPEQNVQHLWDMSPIKYVENVQGALMVMHSDRDDRCPIEQGEQVFNALRRLGKDTKMIMFPDETHELTRNGTPSRRVERLGYIRDWFTAKL